MSETSYNFFFPSGWSILKLRTSNSSKWYKINCWANYFIFIYFSSDTHRVSAYETYIHICTSPFRLLLPIPLDLQLASLSKEYKHHHNIQFKRRKIVGVERPWDFLKKLCSAAGVLHHSWKLREGRPLKTVNSDSPWGWNQSPVLFPAKWFTENNVRTRSFFDPQLNISLRLGRIDERTENRNWNQGTAASAIPIRDLTFLLSMQFWASS